MKKTCCAVTLVVCLAGVGCGGDRVTPFAGDPVAGTIGDPGDFCQEGTEGLKIQKNGEYDKPEVGKTAMIEGGGCVNRPLREVWAATHNGEFFSLPETENTKLEAKTPPPAGNTHMYRTWQEGCGRVGPVKKCADWYMHWYHSLVNGNWTEPKKVRILYTKVEGTSYIQFWECIMILKERSAKVTSFSVHEEIKAERTGPDSLKKGLETTYDRLKNLKPNWDAINAHLAGI